jgi:hypothetical protein
MTRDAGQWRAASERDCARALGCVSNGHEEPPMRLIAFVLATGPGCADAPEDTDTVADTDSDTDTETDSDTDTDTDTDTDAGLVDARFFSSAPTYTGSQVVDCELTDGSRTQCLQLTFGANPVPGGPYCPATVDDVAGTGVYDGPTDPGFHLLDRALWEAMEADGYDILDDAGNVRVQSGTGGAHAAPPPAEPACLEQPAVDTLVLTFLIPLHPTQLSVPDEIGDVDLVAVSVVGAPINGPPPSVVDNQGNIPALDPCGGHVDPQGYYHWHLASPTADTILDAYAIDEIQCADVTQDDTALVGFARDGYPIYGDADQDGAVPSDLDACNGHTGATADFPDGVYHYHASSTVAPNLPTCIVGAQAVDAFTFH